MSAFSDLLHWLEFAQLEIAERSDIQKMLTEALDELKSGRTEEHREALFVVHTVLTQLKSDQDPLPGLRFLADRYRRVADKSEEPFGLRLERELREKASALSVAEWCVGAYPVLDEGIQYFVDGFPERLEQALAELDQLLVSAWEPYAGMSVTEEEVTAETVVGHRLLKEGFDQWFKALDEAELAAGQEGCFEQALSLAEEGNRLLVAFQQP
ncbi:MAG: hypothetical protein KC800_18355 [Candidatus Eremiobacteraeota bacterium]|nr:hypothetical protein [Candidatus Eremiobacteraeota bacterium]